MAIVVEFYHNTSDYEVVDKSLEAGPEITVNLKSDTPVEQPEFTFSKTGFSEYYNYCYIPAWDKYYYVSAPVNLMGDMISIKCVEDVLMTLKDEIKELECTVLRNSEKADAYLPDSGYKTRAYQNIVTLPFPNAMNENHVVLMTLG